MKIHFQNELLSSVFVVVCVRACARESPKYSHPSVRLWRWWQLSLGVKGSGPTLRSDSPQWSCSWSPAAGPWPAPLPTTDRTVGEQSGRCCRTAHTSCHRQSTSCSEGCRWCRPCLRCPGAVTTPGWRRSRWRWKLGSPVQTEDLRGDIRQTIQRTAPSDWANWSFLIICWFECEWLFVSWCRTFECQLLWKTWVQDQQW